MNQHGLQHQFYALHRRAWKLSETIWEQSERTQIGALKCLGDSIRECLPILQAAKKERSTVLQFLNLLNLFKWDHSQLTETCRPIVDSLNCFTVAYETWQQVEAYAEKTATTIDFELHTMAVKARELACKMTGKPFEIEARLPAPPEGTNRGQGIVYKLGGYSVGSTGCVSPCVHSSAFGRTSGVHFFEALVLTKDELQIGWATRGWRKGSQSVGEGSKQMLSEVSDLFDDHHFIGFHLGIPRSASSSPPPGTVLGCLLDATQRSFAFFVNGQQVTLKGGHHFSSNPYYVHVYASLLYLNYGQVPFKYPPTQLLARCPTATLTWERSRFYRNVNCMPLIGNQVDDYFSDKKQAKVMRTLWYLLEEGESRLEMVEEKYAQTWADELFRGETYGWRWMQAIVKMKSLPEGELNAWASLVEAVVGCIVVGFTRNQWNSQLDTFLVPYSKIRLAAGETATRTRSQAILFATLLQYKAYYLKYSPITSSLPSFLLSAFLTTADPRTAMFTLIGLGTGKEDGLQEFTNKEFTEKLKEWKGKFERELIENTRKMDNSLAQLHLVIHHFEHSLLSPSALAPAPTATPTSLSPSGCSSQAKLSSDCLSLRSDFGWQSGRSHLSVENLPSFESPVFYFEATLLTSGSMRIGWATKRWQVDGTKLGANELSFGYDGATGCIWHQGVQLRVGGNAPKWQAGDVIGCLLDLTRNKEKFIFYQNGEAIQTNGHIYRRVSKERVVDLPNQIKMFHVYAKHDSLQSITPFISEHPYYAALSLAPYQQVTVNFGHASFRFPPKCLDFWNFQQYSEHLNGSRANKRIKLDNVQLRNPIVAVDGERLTNGDGTPGVTPSANSTTESSFIILEPTVCQLCQKETNFRRRTLEGCAHLAFCVDCSSKNLLCKECLQ